MVRRVAPASAVMFCILTTIVSCDDGRGWKATHPAKGTVLFQGKPPEGAQVILRAEGDADPRAINPRGKVAADGSVVFTTYQSGDGAPAGDYVVTAFWFKDSGPPNLLPDRYSHADQSDLRVRVNAGVNDLGIIQLTP